MAKDISWKAVLIGLVIDIIVSLVFGLAFGLAVGIYYTMLGMTPKELASSLDMHHSVVMQVGSLACGALSTLIAGFITGWLAKAAQMKNAMIMGVLSVLLSVPFIFAWPVWFFVVACILTLVPAIMGGSLAEIIFGRARETPGSAG